MKHMFAIAVLLALGAGPEVATAQNPVERCKNHFILASPCARLGPVAPSMLAFVSERDGNSEIYVVNVDGTGLQRLTSDAGQDVDPAWSPDAERIAFASDRAGRWDIYVMDADGSNVVRRTETGQWNSSPAWSADGTKIAFSSLRDGQYGLYVMNVDGDWGNPTRVGFDRGWNGHPAWSPDGERIAFVSDWRAFDFVYDLYVVSADGSRITTLIEGPFNPFIFYFQPSWSPDGARIAVVVCGYAWENCYPSSSIAVANADGSGLKTLVQTSGYARPTWSPDGSTIAFSSRACSACEGELRYVSADGSISGVIFPSGHSPAWRPYTSSSNGNNPTARQ
jgi:TolB protein